MNSLLESELIINSDGSVYHLRLKPEHIYENVVTVGDMDRVEAIVKHFDKTHFSIKNREFKTVGGEFNGTNITVISTGIGTDNIDIVLNELNFLVNYDLVTRAPLEHPKQIKLFRLGTSGSVSAAIQLNDIVYSKLAISGDGLFHFYEHPFKEINVQGLRLYEIPCSQLLEIQVSPFFKPSVTYTASGFYGPQFRNAGLKSKYGLEFLNEGELGVGNIEMETAGLYGLGKLFNFEVISINAILAHRLDGSFSDSMDKTVETMIVKALDIICNDAN